MPNFGARRTTEYYCLNYDVVRISKASSLNEVSVEKKRNNFVGQIV